MERPLVAYGRVFDIYGVDKFTQDYFMNCHGREFPLGDIE